MQGGGGEERIKRMILSHHLKGNFMSLGGVLELMHWQKQIPSHYIAALISSSLSVWTMEGCTVAPSFSRRVCCKAWRRKATQSRLWSSPRGEPSSKPGL